MLEYIVIFFKKSLKISNHEQGIMNEEVNNLYDFKFHPSLGTFLFYFKIQYSLFDIQYSTLLKCLLKLNYFYIFTSAHSPHSDFASEY